MQGSYYDRIADRHVTIRTKKGEQCTGQETLCIASFLQFIPTMRRGGCGGREGLLTGIFSGYATPTKCEAFWRLALNSHKNLRLAGIGFTSIIRRG